MGQRGNRTYPSEAPDIVDDADFESYAGAQFESESAGIVTGPILLTGPAAYVGRLEGPGKEGVRGVV